MVRVRRRSSHSRRRRRARLRKRILVSSTIVLGGLAVLALLSVLPALRARSDLEAGRAALVQGERRLLGTDPRSAAADFERADSAFRQATVQAGNPLLRLEGVVPLLGRTPRALSILSEAGLRTAQAGSSLTQGFSALPNGLRSLAPQDGRVPVEQLRALGEPVHAAYLDLLAAAQLTNSVSRELVVPQVARAADLARAQVARVLGPARSADRLLGALPAFLGAGGTRHYFVALQNPGELRGTGGFIGLYTILTVREGRVQLAPFSDFTQLQDLPSAQAPQAPPDYATAFGSFGGSGYWRNLNTAPDAPTVGNLILRLWAAVKGQRLDGVVFLDPQMLPPMMQALGPIDLPGPPGRLTYRDVLPFTLNRAYFVYADGGLRKRILGIAVSEVLDELFSSRASLPALRAVARAAGSGYLTVYSADPAAEAAFQDAGVAGAFGPAGGDFLGVVVNNTAGNKVDYYVRRTLSFDVTLRADGVASTRTEVSLANGAPAGQSPNEALGPYGGPLASLHLVSGEDYSYLSMFCGRTCNLISSTRDGRPAALQTIPQTRDRMLATWMRLPPGESTSIAANTLTSDAWHGDVGGGVYRLRVQGQPTVRPTVATATIRVPPGMHVISTSVPMEVRGGLAIWQGTLSAAKDLEVTFGRSFIPRMWERFREFLSHPVIRIG